MKCTGNTDMYCQSVSSVEITFSFCRLFESSTTEFLSEIINTVKRNSSLKSLKLPGNRLGAYCERGSGALTLGQLSWR